ncbi:MAG TPA: heavy metal-responsive transcriptional regulator [Acidobacteriota bacterium]|nr:heavy metal-responsive transcriptional regulator [Acidobacteriota bacterium]
MKSYYRSGELARLAGVSTDTLRHYERLGLIAKPRRSSNGYREYSVDTLDRVRVIQSAVGLGFTLAELARIFRIRDSGGAPCREVRDLARRKAGELETRLRQIRELRDRLRSMIRHWDGLLADAPPGSPARLLESLAHASTGSVQRTKQIHPRRRNT